MFQYQNLEKLENQLISQIRMVDENQCNYLSYKIGNIQEKYYNTFELIQDMVPISALETKCLNQIDAQSKIKKSEIKDENFMDVLKYIYQLIDDADYLTQAVGETLYKASALNMYQQALVKQYSAQGKASKQQMNMMQLNYQLSQLYTQFNAIFDQANIYLQKYDELQNQKQIIIKKYGDIDQMPAVTYSFVKNVKITQYLIELVVEQFCAYLQFYCKNYNNLIQQMPINNQIKLLKDNILFLVESNQLSLKIIKSFNPNKYNYVKQLILQQLSGYFVTCCYALFYHISQSNYVLVSNTQLQYRISDLLMFNENYYLVHLSNIYDINNYKSFNDMCDYQDKQFNYAKYNKYLYYYLDQIKINDNNRTNNVLNLGFENMLMYFFIFVIHFIVVVHDSIEFLFVRNTNPLSYANSTLVQSQAHLDAFFDANVSNTLQLHYQDSIDKIIGNDFTLLYKNVETIYQAIFCITAPIIGANEYYNKQEEDYSGGTICVINRYLQALIKSNILLIFPMKQCINEMQILTQNISQFNQLFYINAVFGKLFGFVDEIYKSNIAVLYSNLTKYIYKVSYTIKYAGILQMTQQTLNIVFYLIVNECQFHHSSKEFSTNFNVQSDYLYKDCTKLLYSDIRLKILQLSYEYDGIQQQYVNKNMTYTQQYEFQKMQEEQLTVIENKITNLNDINDQITSKLKKMFISDTVNLNTVQQKKLAAKKDENSQSNSETEDDKIDEKELIEDKEQPYVAFQFDNDFLQLTNYLIIKTNEHINQLSAYESEVNRGKYTEIAKLYHLNVFYFVLNRFNYYYNLELASYLSEQINYNLEKYLMDQMTYKLEWVKFLQNIEDLLKQNYVIQDVPTMKNLSKDDCSRVITHINQKKNLLSGFKEISARIQKHIGVTQQKIHPCISNPQFIQEVQKAFKKFLYFKLNALVDEKYKRFILLVDKCYSNKLSQAEKNMISGTEMLQQLNNGMQDFLK